MVALKILFPEPILTSPEKVPPAADKSPEKLAFPLESIRNSFAEIVPLFRLNFVPALENPLPSPVPEWLLDVIEPVVILSPCIAVVPVAPKLSPLFPSLTLFAALNVTRPENPIACIEEPIVIV